MTRGAIVRASKLVNLDKPLAKHHLAPKTEKKMAEGPTNTRWFNLPPPLFQSAPTLATVKVITVAHTQDHQTPPPLATSSMSTQRCLNLHHHYSTRHTTLITSISPIIEQPPAISTKSTFKGWSFDIRGVWG